MLRELAQQTLLFPVHAIHRMTVKQTTRRSSVLRSAPLFPGGTSLAWRQVCSYVTRGRGFGPVTYGSLRGRINRRTCSRPERKREEPLRSEARELNPWSFLWSVTFTRQVAVFDTFSLTVRSAARAITIAVVVMVGKVTGKHLLCLLLLSVALCWAEDSGKDARKADNDTGEVTERRLHIGPWTQLYAVSQAMNAPWWCLCVHNGTKPQFSLI